jgi:AraC family transcriptional regulator
MRFPVTIRDFPRRRVAYIRVLDSYREGVVLKAFADLVEWAKKVDLFDSETIFGMSIDDPLVTPKEKYRYEVCITIPEKIKVDAKYIETTTLPECKYGVVSVSGDQSLAATATNYLFANWLINSPYEPEHLHGLEIFRNKENVCNWEYLDLDLCIPVKKISGQWTVASR